MDVRRSDHDIRVHAGDGARQRSSRGLFLPQHRRTSANVTGTAKFSPGEPLSVHLTCPTIRYTDSVMASALRSGPRPEPSSVLNGGRQNARRSTQSTRPLNRIKPTHRSDRAEAGPRYSTQSSTTLRGDASASTLVPRSKQACDGSPVGGINPRISAGSTVGVTGPRLCPAASSPATDPRVTRSTSLRLDNSKFVRPSFARLTNRSHINAQVQLRREGSEVRRRRTFRSPYVSCNAKLGGAGARHRVVQRHHAGRVYVRMRQREGRPRDAGRYQRDALSQQHRHDRHLHRVHLAPSEQGAKQGTPRRARSPRCLARSGVRPRHRSGHRAPW